jgi:glutamyl-tRNA reductase
MKKFAFSVALVAAAVFASGCDKASSAGSAAASAAKDMKDKGGDAAKGAMDAGKEMLEKAQKELMDKFDMKAVEGKIAALTGDKATAAKASFEKFKTMLTEFKAAPMEKMAEWKDKLMKAYDDLKKEVGL